MATQLSFADRIIFLLENYGVSQDIQGDLTDDIIDVFNTWLLDEFGEVEVEEEDYV